MGNCFNKGADDTYNSNDNSETRRLVEKSFEKSSNTGGITESNTVPRPARPAGATPSSNVESEYVPSSYPTRTPIASTYPPVPDNQKTNFKYIADPNRFVLSRPEFPISELQNTFGNLYVRYDFALQVRLKVDEKLTEFKSVLNVHPDLSLVHCFHKWKEQIDGPTYTVSYTKTARKDVKSILVRGENIPRNLWPAQKFIRELLDACHLFVEQQEFLQQVINEWLTDMERQIGTMQETLDASELRLADRRHILELVPRMRTEYLKTLDWVREFHNQIIVLLDEVKLATSTSLETTTP